MKVLGITVERILSTVDGQVPCEVACQEPNEAQTSDGHEELLPDGSP